MTEDQRSRLAHQQPEGLTVRQWYKGQIASTIAEHFPRSKEHLSMWAEFCGQLADALIAEDEEHTDA